MGSCNTVSHIIPVYRQNTPEDVFIVMNSTRNPSELIKTGTIHWAAAMLIQNHMYIYGFESLSHL